MLRNKLNPTISIEWDNDKFDKWAKGNHATIMHYKRSMLRLVDTKAFSALFVTTFSPIRFSLVSFSARNSFFSQFLVQPVMS